MLEDVAEVLLVFDAAAIADLLDGEGCAAQQLASGAHLGVRTILMRAHAGVLAKGSTKGGVTDLKIFREAFERLVGCLFRRHYEAGALHHLAGALRYCRERGCQEEHTSDNRTLVRSAVTCCSAERLACVLKEQVEGHQHDLFFADMDHRIFIGKEADLENSLYRLPRESHPILVPSRSIVGAVAAP